MTRPDALRLQRCPPPPSGPTETQRCFATLSVSGTLDICSSLPIKIWPLPREPNTNTPAASTDTPAARQRLMCSNLIEQTSPKTQMYCHPAEQTKQTPASRSLVRSTCNGCTVRETGYLARLLISRGALPCDIYAAEN